MAENYEDKYSIIIPVYNRAKILPSAVKSVIQQQYANWECIIIDDGSTDDTLSVCKSLKTDPRIKIYSHSTNKGISAARNTGLRHASGDYILFLDSDDLIKENTLLKLSSINKKFHTDIIVFATEEWTPSPEYTNRLLNSGFIRENILPQHINVHPQTEFFLQPFVWNKCFKKNMLLDSNILFDEYRRTWEDNIFFVYCLNHCKSLFIIDDILNVSGNDSEIDHLSSHVDENLILQYIDSYKYYVREFGKEFNFQNDYTARRYFDVINQQLKKLYKERSKEDYSMFLSNLIKVKEMHSWIRRISPKDKTENKIIVAYKSCNTDKLYRAYSCLFQENNSTNNQTITKFISKIKKRLS